ncbi:hypothetical protein BDQ17DRAFT_971558 [Cyathus striatus]|nr:hypothetical protein BDQ17DRAFT_971558 [Cyathus striatus]
MINIKLSVILLVLVKNVITQGGTGIDDLPECATMCAETAAQAAQCSLYVRSTFFLRLVSRTLCIPSSPFFTQQVTFVSEAYLPFYVDSPPPHTTYATCAPFISLSLLTPPLSLTYSLKDNPLERPASAP